MFRFTVVALLATIAHSRTPDNDSSKLMVQIPRSLYKEEGYDHREALFGIPPYGGSIAQTVYFADADLCSPSVDTRKGYPSRPKDKSGKMAPWEAPYILMVDRGGCTFVNKVRNAQKSGASGVIIADTTCLCEDTDCVKENGSETCEPSEPIMADDGSGGDISIPSFLMFKRDADKIKEVLLSNRPVQLEMKWALPSPDDRVEYDLWTVPSDVVSQNFQQNFKDLAVALGEHAYFTPHMYIYDGVRSNCKGGDGSNMCYTLCTNNGRYCATDPDNDLDKGVSGADVVTESLRRLCIWQEYGEEDGIGERWWDYISLFTKRCGYDKFFKSEDCILDVYKHAKINGAAISRCMRDSGGVEEDQRNVLLEAEIDVQTKRGVVVLPTAFVNTAAIRGALTVGNVFTAICAGFKAGTAPTICDQCASCGDPADCVRSKGVCKKGGRRSHESGGVSTSTFVLSLIFVMGIFGGVGAWYYKKTKEDMRDQVRGILADYMPLEDQDAGGGSPMDFARKGGNVSLIN